MGKLVTPADVLRSASATVSGTSVVSLTSLGDMAAVGANFAGSGDVSQVPRWTVIGNVTAIQGIKSDIDLRDDVINYQSGDVFSFPNGLPSGWVLLGAFTLEYDGAGPEITQLTDFSVQRATFLPDVVSRVIATVVVQQVRPDAFGILKNDLFDSQVSPYTFDLTTLPVGPNPPVVLTALDGSIEIDATLADDGNYFAEYELSENSVPAPNNPGRININVTSFAEMPYLAAIREIAYEGVGAAAIAASQVGPSDARKLGTGTIWLGSSVLHRVAARGAPDTGVAPAWYGFNGNRSRLQYNNGIQRDTRYIKWETAYDPLNPTLTFMCTTPGTTSNGAPVFDVTTQQVSTTADGTVVWTFVGNLIADHRDNTVGWDDQGNLAHVTFCLQNLGNSDAYFYDLAGTALSWREYLIDRVLGTQDDIDIMDWVGGLMVDHEHQRDAPNQYRNRNDLPYPIIHHQLTTITNGIKLDYLATGTRYKGRGLIALIDLQGIAVTGQYSGALNVGGNADLSTITNWNYNGSAYNDGSILDENEIRHTAYTFNNWVGFKRAEFEDTAVLAWPTITVQNQITVPVPMPQFQIAILFEYLHKVMNGIEESSNGWAPFMKGLASKTLINYSQLMNDAGQDPDQHVSSAPLGGAYTFLWSDSAMHGICQPWPTIAAAFQDFFYWMRYTALASDGTPMWIPAFKGWYQRSNSFPLDETAALNGLIAPAYYYTAQLVQEGAPVVTGTHPSFIGWLTDADVVWEGAVENYSWGGTGKQTLQFLSYTVDMIDIRNTVTGRKD